MFLFIMFIAVACFIVGFTLGFILCDSFYADKRRCDYHIKNDSMYNLKEKDDAR